MGYIQDRTKKGILFFRHFSLRQKTGKTDLTQRLVGTYGHGVGKVQAAGCGQHGQADASIPVRLPERKGQPGGLFSEKNPAVVPEPGLAV